MMNNESGLTAALHREFDRYRFGGRDLLVSVLILILSMVVLAWTFSAGTLQELPFAVVDNDNSSLSRSYIRMLDAAPEIRVSEYAASADEVRELIQQGSVYAAVLIPRGFARDIKTGRQTTVVNWHNAQYLTMSGVLTRSVRQVTGTFSAGIEIIARGKRGEGSLAAHVSFEPIQAELRTLFNPHQNYQYFLVAALLPAMLQVFVMAWTVFTVGREFRDQSAAEWLAASNKKAGAAIIAKVLPVFIIASAIGLGCLWWIYDLSGWSVAGNGGIVVLGWEIMICAYIVLGLLTAGFVSNLGTALSVTAAFTAPAFAYAGITFPQQSMPALAQLWTYALPVRSLLRLQIEQVQLGAPAESSVAELLILVAFVLLPLPFAYYRLRSRLDIASAETM